eukprot:scaffold16093_cov54-Phaeocystis_antarctica.AAC.1
MSFSPEHVPVAVAAQSMSSVDEEQAPQQAQAEEVTLLVAENKAGYFGVIVNNPGYPNPYKAQVTRGGK